MADTTTNRPLAFGRIAWTALGIIIAAVATWKFSPLLENKPDVLGIIATVFSILAAALIAVLSILGDPSMLMDQSWRYNALLARETQRKLHRKTDIFVLYIIILGLLFAFVLTDQQSCAYPWIRGAVFFTTVFGFWASLTIPYSLKAIQRKRLDDAIAAKR